MDINITITPAVKPAIPAIIAGITHGQVASYFAELTRITGVGVGYSPVWPRFKTWENHSGRGYTSEDGATPAEAIEKHIAARPPTGIALAQQKLAEAQAFLAAEQAKAGKEGA